MAKQPPLEMRYTTVARVKEPHLIVEHRPGEFLALPPGTKVGIVITSEHKDDLHKLCLWKVSAVSLQFKCMCNPTCTVIHEYRRLPTKGKHAQ